MVYQPDPASRPARSDAVFRKRPRQCLLLGMQGLAVALFPVLLMLFALVMERVENKLRDILEPDEEVQRYLDKASNAEVAELEEMGVPAAAAKFRRRGRKTAPHTEDLDVARAG